MRPSANEYLTRQEAAEYAHVSVSTIRRAAASGELREGGIKGKRLYKRAWLDVWLARALLACAAAVMTMLLTLLVACLLGNDPAHDLMQRLDCPLAPPAHMR